MLQKLMLYVSRDYITLLITYANFPRLSRSLLDAYQISRCPHQISQSPVCLTRSPGLLCSSPTLPISHAGHQISRSPVQVIKSPGLPCRSSNLPDLKESSNFGKVGDMVASWLVLLSLEQAF